MSEAWFKEKIEDIKKQNQLDDKTFEVALKQQGMTIEELRKRFEIEYDKQGVSQREVAPRVSITEEEARQYYRAHPEEFMKPTMITVREITVLVPGETRAGEQVVNAALDEAASAKVKAARERALKGEDFTKLVAEFSESSSKANGGLIGPLNLNELAEGLSRGVPRSREQIPGTSDAASPKLDYKAYGRGDAAPRPSGTPGGRAGLGTCRFTLRVTCVLSATFQVRAGETPGMRILVVDDEPAVRVVSRAGARPKGYDVVLAEDGDDALRVVQRDAPELVVLDVLMPALDGIAVCRRAAVAPATGRPILMLTARDAVSRPRLGPRCGCRRLPREAVRARGAPRSRPRASSSDGERRRARHAPLRGRLPRPGDAPGRRGGTRDRADADRVSPARALPPQPATGAARARSASSASGGTTSARPPTRSRSTSVTCDASSSPAASPVSCRPCAASATRCASHELPRAHHARGCGGRRRRGDRRLRRRLRGHRGRAVRAGRRRAARPCSGKRRCGQPRPGSRFGFRRLPLGIAGTSAQDRDGQERGRAHRLADPCDLRSSPSDRAVAAGSSARRRFATRSSRAFACVRTCKGSPRDSQSWWRDRSACVEENARAAPRDPRRRGARRHRWRGAARVARSPLGAATGAPAHRDGRGGGTYRRPLAAHRGPPATTS